jgi:hypothetical protein
MSDPSSFEESEKFVSNYNDGAARGGLYGQPRGSNVLKISFDMFGETRKYIS